jgi:hypothetical protein
MIPPKAKKEWIKPNVHHYLSVAANHITETDWDLLFDESFNNPMMPEFSSEFQEATVFCCRKAAATEYGYTPAMLKVIDLAVEVNAYYIIFGKDDETYPTFEVYPHRNWGGLPWPCDKVKFFDTIMENPEVFPILMGLDPALDKLLAKKLSGQT